MWNPELRQENSWSPRPGCFLHAWSKRFTFPHLTRHLVQVLRNPSTGKKWWREASFHYGVLFLTSSLRGPSALRLVMGGGAQTGMRCRHPGGKHGRVSVQAQVAVWGAGAHVCKQSARYPVSPGCNCPSQLPSPLFSLISHHKASLSPLLPFPWV